MDQKHIVAVVGGAVSGAEAVHNLTEQGIECVVFDQNLLPYGKIEDGLPKWHSKLRDKEEGKINERLANPLVHFVPGARLGRDIQLAELATDWGFSAVFLAIGAWRDRPLPIEGIDQYIGKGLIYQNPFIYWYNHKHEPQFEHNGYEIKDGAVVVGGGLASLDVLKVLMIETVQNALRERGHDYNMFQLDRSIAKVLEELGLTLDDLGIEGCTLYYRRRIKDMPLSPTPITSPEMREKVEGIREKVLNNYASKYLFKVKPQHVPVSMIENGSRLEGLVFKQTEIVDGRAVPIEGSEIEVRAPYIISSIGSIPESIPGIPMRGNMYDIIQDPCCRVRGYNNVFALGNTVTGRGNIRESAKHGKEVATKIIDHYINSQTPLPANKIDGVVPFVPKVTGDKRDAIVARVKTMQEAAGYDGDFEAWVQKHTPTRLEEMIGGH